MSKTHEPCTYSIRIKGTLGEQWLSSFAGMLIDLGTDGETCLTGSFVDQAGLYSQLRKIRDLGMELISVYRIETD